MFADLQANFMTVCPGWLTPSSFPLYASPSQFPEEQAIPCQVGSFPMCPQRAGAGVGGKEGISSLEDQ